MKIIKLEKSKIDELIHSYKGYENALEKNEYLLHSFYFNSTLINV